MIDRINLRRMLSLKRPARRRLVVAYWLGVLLFIAILSAVSQRQGSGHVDGAFFSFWWTLILLPMLLRALTTFSTRGSELQTLLKPAKSGQGSEPRPLDERELGLHNRMHTKAYYLLQIFVPVGVLLLTPPEIHRSAWLDTVRIPMLWLLAMVVTSLPQSMILWVEPDMEESDAR
jgi:cytochrome bd-type quinol oxidase subunit 2